MLLHFEPCQGRTLPRGRFNASGYRKSLFKEQVWLIQNSIGSLVMGPRECILMAVLRNWASIFQDFDYTNWSEEEHSKLSTEISTWCSSYFRSTSWEPIDKKSGIANSCSAARTSSKNTGTTTKGHQIFKLVSGGVICCAPLVWILPWNGCRLTLEYRCFTPIIIHQQRNFGNSS